MAILLNGAGNPVQYIDIDPDKVPYSFKVKLEDRTYRLTFRYNGQGDFYTVDLETTAGEALCYGDIVRYGRPLFGPVEEERFPLPVLIPQCLSGNEISVITRENFGREVKLYLHERRVRK